MPGADVSIAIVVPWIHGIRGHRISMNLARELDARGARVDCFTGRVYDQLVPTFAAGIGRATLHVGRTLPTGKTSMLRYARFQYSRLLDRELSTAIAVEHRKAPFDIVFVVSNEGHWLAGYLRRLLSPCPWMAVNVREMVEHPFWLGYERPWRLARTWFSPLYPLAHQIEVERLRQFDAVFSNSPWTSGLLDYFYGIRRSPSLMMVDPAFFETPLGGASPEYIAVPTAALDAAGVRLAQQVAQRVPNLRTYGRREVPGIPHAGFLSDADLVRFIANAGAMLSIFDYEALGLIPLEALAAGTPVAMNPKHAPYALLSGNTHVRFGDSVEELSGGLAELTGLSTNAQWRAAGRESMRSFHPAAATDRWLADVARLSNLGPKLAGLRRADAAGSSGT
jgi:hypothetical protein